MRVSSLSSLLLVKVLTERSPRNKVTLRLEKNMQTKGNSFCQANAACLLRHVYKIAMSVLLEITLLLVVQPASIEPEVLSFCVQLDSQGIKRRVLVIVAGKGYFLFYPPMGRLDS